MISQASRPAPLDVRLFFYWKNLPRGRGVTMQEMATAMGVADYQAIRSSLTRLRKGRVPDPSKANTHLVPLPVRWNLRDRMYYDLSNISPESVMAQIPGSILSGAFSGVLTRVATLEASMGPHGLGAAATAKHLLSDSEMRALLLQIPFDEIWRVQDYLQGIARARQLLELQTSSTKPALPAP